MAHADLSDAGRVSHFEIDGQLPTPDEKGALAGDPIPPSDANRYLTQNHAAGGFDGFANPTASVGLVAVNGVATTAMRSDGAPALDQAIIPTWAGLHTFGAGLAISAGQGIAMADGTWIGQAAGPLITFDDTLDYLEITGCDVVIGGPVATTTLTVISAAAGGIHIDSGTDGVLWFDRGVNTSSAGIQFQTAGAIDWSLGTRILGPANSDLRLYNSNVGAFGMIWESVTNRVVVGSGTAAARLHVIESDDVTAAVTIAQRLTHTTSGAAAPLFGVGQEHELEDAGGAMQVASEVATLWATATAGAESPLYRGTTYPIGAAGPGYWGFWTWDSLDDNARTIVPNGVGDVTSGIIIMYRVRESGGGAEGNVVMVANGGAVDLYDDGTDVFTLTVNADGSVTVVRSAGATTAKLALLMCWI